MKKFLAILTIVAMLSSMVVIGASAASTYAFEEDFTGYADCTIGAHERTNLNTKANAIAHSSKTTGLYANGNGAVSGDAAITAVDGAAQSTAFWIKVPDFFEGKNAGTYTIEFDYISAADVYAQRLDVGGTLNACENALWSGSTKWIQNKEGFNQYNLAVFGRASASDWAHASLTFEWDGTNTIPTFEVAGSGNNTMAVADYDVQSLCMKIYASDNSLLKIDNLKVGNVIEEAEVALESTIAPLVVAPYYEEDFNDDYAYAGENTQFKHPNANDVVAADALAHKDTGVGLYAQGYSASKPADAQFTLVERAAGDYAIEAPRVFLKIPNFFEGQTAGNYVVEFDVKLVGHTTTFYLQRLNVGATANQTSSTTWGGNAVWIKGEEGFSQYNWLNPGINTADTGWQKVKLFIPYKGSVVETAKTNYDANALVLGFTPTTYNAATKYQFDNFKVYPVDNTTGTVVDYAGKDMVVNNTVYVNNGAPLNAEVINAAYDQNGNLRAVGTAPVAIAAGEANKTANVTIEDIPAGVTANWTFKSFIWSDLDNEIEPLYDAVNPFDANVKQSIGVEFNPVTSVPEEYTTGTYTMAKDWVSDGAYCLTDYALNGRYSMFIPNGKSAYLVDDGFLAANGEGVYTVRVWMNGDNTLMTRLNMNGKSRRHNGDTDPYMLNNATHVLDADGTTKIKKTVNGKDYYLHQVTLETALLTGDSSKEPQGFKFGAYNGDKWVEVESIVFTPAQ